MRPDDDDDDKDATSDAGNAAAEDDVFVEQSAEVENSASLLGEFDGEEEEDINFARPDAGQIKPLPISKELKELMELRVGAVIKLEELDAKRQQLLLKEGLPEPVKLTLNMQNAEMRTLPEKEQIEEKRRALQSKIAKIREQLQDQAENPGDYPADKRIAPPGAEMETAWATGMQQYALLLQRADVLPDLIAHTEVYLKAEPFYQLLSAFHYPAKTLFGLAIYQLGLENWSFRMAEKRKEVQKQQVSTSDSGRSFFNRPKKQDQEEHAKQDEQIEFYGTVMSCINREIASLQKTLVTEFWKAYEFCACLLVSGKIPPERLPPLRAYLRYGLLGHAPWFISPEVREHIVLDCLQNVKTTYSPSMQAENVVYADEYIAMIVNGDFTPSIDENLELTARNTPEWNADKALRRIAYSRTRSHVLKERRADLVNRITLLRHKQEEMILLKSKLIKGGKDYKKRNAELAQGIQHCKVEAARFERVVERIDNKELPDLSERVSLAKERLTGSGVNLSAFGIARKEAAGIHRVCRLCAKLKDPFLPLVLRDNFKLDTGVVNSRAEMVRRLEFVESCDRNIFNDLLVNSRKEQQRIYMRYHPVFLITPSCGFIGYSWNPRVGVETGKLVFPGYCPRPGLVERMIFNMLADFRWDTSKAAAGVDLLTSDTLVAAYSTVRWEYRKKKKENREKALIFNEINDRQNWRRHYELFLQSAQDSGRKLFFKSYEVYEMIVKYVGLPEGKERLRR